MEAVKILPHYTYNDYLHWEGKWEIIEGIPYAMSPAPIPKHQLIASNLSALFFQALTACNKCKAYQPVDYVLADDTVLQPDLLIVCREITKAYLDFPPALVVEILSPSTALKDRHSKYALYQTQRIAYYLIIDPVVEEVEVYELKDDSYQLVIKGKDIEYSFLLEDCKAKLEFNKIW